MQKLPNSLISSDNPSAELPSSFSYPQLGLISGGGEFPALVAKIARQGGTRVVAVAFSGETNPALEKSVDEMHWLALGQLGKILKVFKSAGIQYVVMAGLIRHKQLFAKLKLDLHAIRLLTQLQDKRADSILRAVADKLEHEGIKLISPLPLLKAYLPQPGVLTRRRPTRREEQDIEFGYRIAKHIAGADIGQTVVVKDQAVVAVEAMEGTDLCILRSGRYVKSGAVIVKVTKPSQDLRFDTPVLGPKTIRSLKSIKASVLAFDSGKTLMLQKEHTIAEANRSKITLIAL